jgi:hypothetical protein
VIGLGEVHELGSHGRHVWSIGSELDRELDHGADRVIGREVIGTSAQSG